MKPLEQRVQELEAEHIRMIDQIVDMANEVDTLTKEVSQLQRNFQYLVRKMLEE